MFSKTAEDQFIWVLQNSFCCS